jgi:hypothetical protein
MAKPMSLYQIRREGWQALTQRLGPAGAMRFMMQYDTGYGDYTEERRHLFADLTIDEAIEALNKQAHSEEPR